MAEPSNSATHAWPASPISHATDGFASSSRSRDAAPSTPLSRSKTKRSYDKANIEVPFSPVPLVFGSESGYDRAPVVRKSSNKPDSNPGMLRGVASVLEMSDLESQGYLSLEQCLKYLVERVRDTLEVRWDPQEFVEFAQFHIRAVCAQSHIEQDIFTYEDLERMVTTMRAVDNSEFIGTRLFRQHDDASVALRKSMRVVWTKRGEIVQSQSERLSELTVLYHGTASGIRQTESKRLQRVVQLGSGQVFGFIEMILGVPSMLTLSMESEGTVLMLPIDRFISVMKADETLLWNVMYETLTEIHRISLFIQAAPFPKEATEMLPELEPETTVPVGGVAAAVMSQHHLQQPVPLSVSMEPPEIVERVFGVTISTPEELKEFRVVTLAPDSPLYEKGSRAVALWVLLDGELDLPEHLHSRVNGARIVGEMGLLTRQDRSRDVKTITRCVLLRMSLNGLHMLVQKDIEVMWKMARPALANVVTLLSQIHVGFEHRLIKSGKQLYRAGESSENLYILINGRLRIVDGQNQFKHDVSKPGESVGEMSLLSGTAHQHNCFAVRDTELLVLNRDAFNAVLEEDPQQYVKNLFKMVQERTTSSGSKYGNKPNPTKTVAIMSTNPDVHVDTFTERLFGAIHAQGSSVRLITGEMVGSRFPAVKKVDDMLFSRGISYYVHNQEDNYDYILCLADHNSKSVWTRWILRQVDLVLLVGYADESPRPTLELELGVYAGEASYRPEVHLALVHPDCKRPPKNTQLWLQDRKVSQHHHIVVDRAADFQRLARIITGCSVGLVLSGGGARGIAHIGAMRALLENGVPIDMVCGTSMGSQVAGLLALELPLPEIQQRLENFYLRGYYRAIFWDLTLPIVSIMTGEAFGNRMKRLFGGTETCVEDTWLPYFAVSTNLTTRSAYVHTEGPLWEATRAASSLPLLFPPVVTKVGVLMDGGLINNMPVDMARQRGCDIIIAVDVSTPGNLPEMPLSTHQSGWWLLLQKLTGGGVYSSAMEMLLYLTQMVDEASRSERFAEADLSIRPEVSGHAMLDFSVEAQRELLQRGQSAAVTALQNLKSANPLVYSKLVGQLRYDPAVTAHHIIRSNNHWRRIAFALLVFLGGLSAVRFKAPIGALVARLRRWLSIFEWGEFFVSLIKF